MTTTTGRGKKTMRMLAACVALLLAAAGTAVASHRDAAPTLAFSRDLPPSSTTSTEEPTTSTEPTTTTAAAPVTTAARPAPTAPRSTTPRPATTRPKPPPPPPPPPSGMTAAFYYGWYDGASHGSFQYPGTKYHPTAGYYRSTDLGTVKNQIGQMRYAGIQAGIASWWGPGSSTDQAFPVGLQAAHGTPFQWTVYFESSAFPDRSPGALHNATQYVADHYGNDPNYLHIGGRPVIFVWPNDGDGCDMVNRWQAANTGFYVVQKRFTGWESCKGAADSWHEYSPNLYKTEVKGFSFSVSPGFNRYDSGGPYLGRDPGQFDAAVAAMAGSTAQWKLVTTFNEWGEGTAVEPATEWATPSGYGVYLDILHNHLGSR